MHTKKGWNVIFFVSQVNRAYMVSLSFMANLLLYLYAAIIFIHVNAALLNGKITNENLLLNFHDDGDVMLQVRWCFQLQ